MKSNLKQELSSVITESVSNPFYYLLSKKKLAEEVGNLEPKDFNKNSFILVKDYAESKKQEILDIYKEQGYTDIIQISKDTFNELSPYLTREVAPALEFNESKNILKEIEDKTPGFKKYEDKPLIKDIKSFFEKNKKSTLVNVQLEGNGLTIDAELKYKSDEENLVFARNDARQAVYDLKVDLEKELQKKYEFLPLTVQGIDVRKDKALFEILTMVAHKSLMNVGLYVDNVNTIKNKNKSAKEKQLEIALLTEKIERISGKKVIFKEDRKPRYWKDIIQSVDEDDLKNDWDITNIDSLEHYTTEELYPNTSNPQPLDYFDEDPRGDKFILLNSKTGQEYFVVRSGYSYCRYVYKLNTVIENPEDNKLETLENAPKTVSGEIDLKEVENNKHPLADILKTDDSDVNLKKEEENNTDLTLDDFTEEENEELKEKSAFMYTHAEFRKGEMTGEPLDGETIIEKLKEYVNRKLPKFSGYVKIIISESGSINNAIEPDETILGKLSLGTVKQGEDFYYVTAVFIKYEKSSKEDLEEE